jgi:hypothetical protein
MSFMFHFLYAVVSHDAANAKYVSLELYYLYAIIGWNHYEYGPRSKHPLALPTWHNEFGTHAQLKTGLVDVLLAGKQKQDKAASRKEELKKMRGTQGRQTCQKSCCSQTYP